jgi:hypothetical protein
MRQSYYYMCHLPQKLAEKKVSDQKLVALMQKIKSYLRMILSEVAFFY